MHMRSHYNSGIYMTRYYSYLHFLHNKGLIQGAFLCQNIQTYKVACTVIQACILSSKMGMDIIIIYRWCPLLCNNGLQLVLTHSTITIILSPRILFSVQSVLVCYSVLLWVWLPSLMHMQLDFEKTIPITATAAPFQLQSLVKLQL